MARLKKLLKKRNRLKDDLELFALELKQVEGSYSERLVTNEYDKTQHKLKKLECKIQKELAPFDDQKEKWRHDSEDLEALHTNLDDAGVPRYEDDAELSAWGRVLLYKNNIDNTSV